jgi:hypothetical protein
MLEMRKDCSSVATHAQNKKREPVDDIWVSKGLDLMIGSGFLVLGDACLSPCGTMG